MNSELGAAVYMRDEDILYRRLAREALAQIPVCSWSTISTNLDFISNCIESRQISQPSLTVDAHFSFSSPFGCAIGRLFGRSDG